MFVHYRYLQFFFQKLLKSLINFIPKNIIQIVLYGEGLDRLFDELVNDGNVKKADIEIMISKSVHEIKKSSRI